MNTYTRPFGEIGLSDIAYAGGKGASLGELTKIGIPVPPGFVILAHTFEKFLEITDIGVEINSAFKKVKVEDINSVEKTSEVIKNLILESQIPETIKNEILKSFRQLNVSLVAVRSSATAEDSSVASWAGELETYLNTDEALLLENVKRCWASLFTPRAIYYRFDQGLASAKISVAVVVQKMAQSEVSGIAFTAHPVTKDKNQVLIEAIYGLGEPIVSGEVTPDSYVCLKATEEILDKNIANQERLLAYNAKKKVNEFKLVEFGQREKQKLSDRKIKELVAICQKLEDHYKKPQDIEWALEKDSLYLVQSRPITTL